MLEGDAGACIGAGIRTTARRSPRTFDRNAMAERKVTAVSGYGVTTQSSRHREAERRDQHKILPQGRAMSETDRKQLLRGMTAMSPRSVMSIGALDIGG
jgi:hypothetical protein